MKKQLICGIALTLALLAASAQAAEPLAFQGVMKVLGKHMQTITAAIANEDWVLVAQTASLIAAHPQPSVTEKARIFAYIGSNMGKFKNFDMQTHEAAHELAHAAEEKNGLQIINAFQKLQAGCLGCHQNFRAAFIEHFYGKEATKAEK